ncbi:glycerol-3-phosphate acyltransferase [Halothermothrix orenii]|uniref:Glycerol-3-phosphate acyltransferase n=1 Tax=Halothermothrix orenii (strain H 168 / OCM 544 / DSM 9562) TaxID=373903 RepID=B8CYV8_HALOH|nr:glycerol-3-phosphate acyltransferase [Halothermothrix orenii]ACL70477.1 acyl-phosphate glycerol-3-phosphate acyltransferase [Halothermothrix orenii H 168]
MELLMVILSYLSGSLSPAIMIAKIKGVNIRGRGTRNPGASNVYKLIGPVWGVLTGALDFIKGIIPVYLAKGVFNFSNQFIILVAFSVIIGHNWPLFYGFNGGRGLATTLGTMAVVGFVPGIISFVIGGGLCWYLTSKFDKEVRIPFVTYPLFLLLTYYMLPQFIIYAAGIMAISYLRAYQVRLR